MKIINLNRNSLKNIFKIEIESEGETNGFFKILMKDGKEYSGWSCDQGSIEMDIGIRLSPWMNNLLMELWFSMDIDPEYEGRHESEWIPGIPLIHRLGSRKFIP
jgi:hypothetical protein